MRTRHLVPLSFLLFISALVLLVGCMAKNSIASATSHRQASTGAVSAQTSTAQVPPAATEKIPTGDIPDTQAFVTYTSAPGGYSLEVPEGWARSVNGADVRFVSNLDGVSVKLVSESNPPTVDSLRSGPIAELKSNGTAVSVTDIHPVKQKGVSAIEVVYNSNSALDPVTGKSVRLENNTYYYIRNGTLAELRLWAPLGADNVDQWQRISSSFTWRNR
ncbi:MAG TPA: hypothetical protein VMW87_05380 [Spirochaetia bacterium]|nr:hypothetical protein [Spirochaetia bacterium]